MSRISKFPLISLLKPAAGGLAVDRFEHLRDIDIVEIVGVEPLPGVGEIAAERVPREQQHLLEAIGVALERAVEMSLHDRCVLGRGHEPVGQIFDRRGDEAVLQQQLMEQVDEDVEERAGQGWDSRCSLVHPRAKRDRRTSLAAMRICLLADSSAMRLSVLKV